MGKKFVLGSVYKDPVEMVDTAWLRLYEIIKYTGASEGWSFARALCSIECPDNAEPVDITWLLMQAYSAGKITGIRLERARRNWKRKAAPGI